jgi:hypothetical protein
MANASPKLKREVVEHYNILAKDYLKGDAAKRTAEQFGLTPSAVSAIVYRGQKREQPAVAQPVIIPARYTETLTSTDFEIQPAQPRSIMVPQSDSLVDEHGRYELTKGERWCILPDTQIPFHDQRSLDAVLQYLSSQRWDGCIQLGDFMDWDFCSRWSADNARKAEGQRFLQEYITANDVLDQIQVAVRTHNPDCHLIVLEGNHDWRVQNVIDKTPSLAGMIDMESNLRFDERNALFWRYWVHKKPIIIGKAYFIHGDFIGTHHAKKTADSYHRNVFYGHTHALQAYTKTTLAEDSVQCWSLGTLSRFDLEYMGKRPSSWMQCFAEFYFRPDGSFNHYVTNVIDHSFTAVNGDYYAG